MVSQPASVFAHILQATSKGWLSSRDFCSLPHLTRTISDTYTHLTLYKHLSLSCRYFCSYYFVWYRSPHSSHGNAETSLTRIHTREREDRSSIDFLKATLCVIGVLGLLKTLIKNYLWEVFVLWKSIWSQLSDFFHWPLILGFVMTGVCVCVSHTR